MYRYVDVMSTKEGVVVRGILEEKGSWTLPLKLKTIAISYRMLIISCRFRSEDTI